MALAFHPLDPRSARQRLLLAISAGAAAWIAMPATVAMALRALVAWDAGALLLLSLAWWIIARADGEETQRRAAAEDPGRRLVYLVVVFAGVWSVVGAASVVHAAGADPDGGDALVLALSVATVVLSWLLTHTAFTLRYAHLYYRGGPDDEGGLDFPGDGKPDDFDFAYFAFTIGMCFQTSDVSVSDRSVRRTVLAHSLLSFAYNTLIVALVLNLVIGHL
jgi:uncharacterized membrane protein